MNEQKMNNEALADSDLYAMIHNYGRGMLLRGELAEDGGEMWRAQKIKTELMLEEIRAALRAQAVPELYCVGRANYPPRGGNVGINWHVVGVADVPYRTCVPKNGELLFVLAASKSEGKV